MIEFNRRQIIQLFGIGGLSSMLSSKSYAQVSRERVFIKPTRGNKNDVIRSLPSEASNRVEYDNFNFISVTIPEQARLNLEQNPNIEYVESDSEIKIYNSFRERFGNPFEFIKNNPRNNTDDTNIKDSIPLQDDEIDEEEDAYNDCSEEHSTQSTPWGVSRVGADKSEYTGKNVNIAILDTGIESKHCSLSVKGGKNFSDDGSEDDYQDKHGHGTHVAGIASALDNNIGVKGVAPESNLYALKVLNDDGSGFQSWMAAGIDWCISNDIEIINLSIGGEQGSSAVDEMITTAYEEGHLLIASAGNNGNDGSGSCSESNVSYPATHKDIMAVSAMTEDEKLADYSSVGSEIEIMAPGSNILSTYINDNYATLNGTSMASPHISGIAAQYWEKYNESNTASNENVREAINNNSETILDNCTEGNGLGLSVQTTNDSSEDPEDNTVPDEPEDNTVLDEPEDNTVPDEPEDNTIPDEPEDRIPSNPQSENVSERRRRVRSRIRSRIRSWFGW